MATAKKKTLTKDDLRRLMKEQSSAKAASKRIESPLAKYNSLGNLVCVVCNCQVKSEALWNAHILGRSHKEAIELKNTTKAPQQQPVAVSGALKRKIEADANGGSSMPPVKNGKFIEPGATATGEAASQQTAAGGVIATGYSSSSSEDDDDDEPAQPSKGSQPAAVSNAALLPAGVPADFFAGSASSASNTKPVKPSEVLPEGFFDDPKQDAKIRQVEYRDKMEDEWELFQKVMKEETIASEAIIAEDDDQAAEERQLEQVDEQITRWAGVDRIGKQVAAITSQPKPVLKSSNEDPDDAEAADFGDLFDWRSKRVMMP